MQQRLLCFYSPASVPDQPCDRKGTWVLSVTPYMPLHLVTVHHNDVRSSLQVVTGANYINNYLTMILPVSVNLVVALLLLGTVISAWSPPEMGANLIL